MRVKPNASIRIECLKREIHDLRALNGRRLSVHEITDQLLQLSDVLARAHDAGLSAEETIRLVRPNRAKDDPPDDTNP